MNKYLKHLKTVQRLKRRLIKIILLASVLVLLITACGAPAVSKPMNTSSTPTAPAMSTPVISNSNPIPFFAYYYIWFDTTSWDRAKKDYPLLGRYSSDDVSVMRQHIQWAKAAGIEGFIVSWKSTDKLNSRLAQLIKVADEENFKLAMIYQGLDFNRNPLPVSQVANDFDYFIQHFAKDPAFDTYSKPVMIWSGTWEFSPQDIASVTKTRRSQLLILASEKNVAGYQRLNGMVDGDAYYWSSVNPDTFPNYPQKLAAMGQAVHAQGGLWIAPAAAGFDAVLLNKTTIIDRKDGETLRTEIKAALQSTPDMIGVISWNEFSENSYIEPSEKYGHKYLDVLSAVSHTALIVTGGPVDSSDPGNLNLGRIMNHGGGIALGLLAGLIIFSGIILLRRH